MNIRHTLIISLLVIISFSFDIFSQWIHSNLYEGANVTALAAIGNRVFAGTSGAGIYLTTNNGINWTAVNSGLYVTSNMEIKIIKVTDGDILYAVTNGGLFRSTNYGSEWNQVFVGGMPVASFSGFASLGNKMFATSMIGFYRSTDNGVSWPQINTNINIIGSSVLAIDRTHFFMGLNLFMLHSTNDGDTWDEIKIGLPQFYSVQAFTFIGSTLFAGSISGLYKLQGDTSWVPCSSSMIYSLISSGTQLFAGTSKQGVIKSTDFGNTWSSADLGSSADVVSLAISGTNLFAGTFGDGVWLLPNATPVELSSFNSGIKDGIITLNWNTATETNNKGFEIQRKTSVTDFISVAFATGKGTSTKPNNYTWSEKVQPGIYSYRLKQLDYNGKFEYSKSIEVTVNPSIFNLKQNYPNPFNPVTTIEYSIPFDSHVTLKIYDLLGKEVASLINENKLAGNYSIAFDAGKLNSAVYIYELRSGNFIQTKKMILLK